MVGMNSVFGRFKGRPCDFVHIGVFECMHVFLVTVSVWLSSCISLCECVCVTTLLLLLLLLLLLQLLLLLLLMPPLSVPLSMLSPQLELGEKSDPPAVKNTSTETYL